MGWSIDALAAYAKWDKGNLSRFERGQQDCSIRALAALAAALQLPVRQLFPPAKGKANGQ